MLPTDTVYGLVATAGSAAAALRLYAAKGRPAGQPTALVAASVAVLFDAIPELVGRDASIVGALLPGAYTLVVANPARRFPWLCGSTPEAIGVRVPALAGVGRAVLDQVGTIVATSANEPGGREARRVSDLSPAITAIAACVVDGGELPGTSSTIIDITAREPRVLRSGAGDVDVALARIGDAPRRPG